MDRFSKLHPIFHFLYFIGMFALVVSVYNPFFVAVSFLGVLMYEIKCRGRQTLSSLKLTIAVVLVVSIFNMLFAHYGEDVLFVIGNTEFTLEALFYGVNQGLTLATMILWFGAFSRTTDSEKVIYVFRFAPKTALLFSMVLGFIPRFSRKLKEIEDAQLGLNGGHRRDSRIKTAINNLSALVSYSLESSIITADSMTAREYNPKAVRYNRYKITPADLVLIAVSVLAIACVAFAKITDRITFIFEPTIYSKSFDYTAFAFFCFFSLLPVAVDLTEEILWKISYAKN